MFLLKATERRDTVAGFIAHLPTSWGYISHDKRSSAHRDFFFILFFTVFFPPFRAELCLFCGANACLGGIRGSRGAEVEGLSAAAVFRGK